MAIGKLIPTGFFIFFIILFSSRKGKPKADEETEKELGFSQQADIGKWTASDIDASKKI